MKEEADRITAQVEALKQKLTDFIDTLPETDDIRHIGPNCGMISMSVIARHAGILCPSYYFGFDLKEHLKDTIRKANVTSLDGIISRIIEKKSYEAHGHVTPIRSDIIDKIKEFWYGKDSQ